MKNNCKKVLVYALLAISLCLPMFGIFETGNVYAATNTKSGTASDMVAVATAQKNKTDGSKYIKYTFKTDKYRNWCAAFVSWCANQAGAKSFIKNAGSCNQLYKNIINAGGTVVKKPKAGDIIFYHNNATAKGEYCHVGIVVKVTKSSVETVQGNIKLKDYPDGIVYNTLEATAYQLGTNNKNYTIVYLRPNYNETDNETSTSDDATVDSSTNSTSATTSKYETITNLGGATINIINKASGKALNVHGSNTSSTNKSNVEVSTLTATNKSSQFKITKTSGGWYSISPVSNTKLAVNPYSDTPKNGTNVNVYTKDTSDKTQGWVVRKIGDDYVILSAYNKSLALTVDNSNVKLATYSEGNSKQLWSFTLPTGQIWGSEEEIVIKEDDKKVEDTNISGTSKEDTITKEDDTNNENEDITSLISGTKYYICNKASGKALDVYGDTDSSTNKSNVQIYKLNKSSKCAQFKVIETSGGWYSIVPMSNTKLAVNPYSDKPTNGTNVNVYTKDTSDKTQGWIFEKEGDYYIIRSAYKNSLVLTAKGTSDKSNVELATYSKGNSKQLWKLSEVK